jgi:hypothetical protein
MIKPPKEAKPVPKAMYSGVDTGLLSFLAGT